jgi:hypothetical protein
LLAASAQDRQATYQKADGFMRTPESRQLMQTLLRWADKPKVTDETKMKRNETNLKQNETKMKQK